MPDGAQDLDIEMQRQWKVIEFQGNSFRLHRCNLSAQCHVDVRASVLAIKGARTENHGLADRWVSDENEPDGFERIGCQAKSHG